ncbi:MAG: dTDP-4-dehydrorhamnose 3,5-epimerase [Enterobacterales bacterium]|jgi:dTDP-4-dehydrorhamnose 3,5-epimerase
MKIIETSIKDIKIIEPQVFGDERGFFLESYRENWFRENIADVSFVQDNHSKSSNGILRGMHYQIKQPQGKLVRVISGEVYDVAVDMRQSSSTFGQWEGILLSAENKRQLWVPPGFAHGFYVTSKSAEFVYKCTDYYAPEHEKSLLWNDTKLNIQWPIPASESPQLSAKDKMGLSFNDSEYFS